MARVLIVDDEQGFRRSIQQFLKKEGHKVAAADSAEKALEILKEREFDVVVTDIVMPRVNGMDLLKSIKESRPNIPVIIMTGEPTVDTAIKAVQAEAFDYLVKPFSREDICKTVRNAANQKALEDENRQYREHMEELVQERTRELQKSEEQFRQIYEHMAVGVARISMDFRIESANDAYCHMIGYREEELIGKHIRDFTHPELVVENLQKQSQLGAGKIDHYRMEKRFIHKSGRSIHGILNANLIRNAEGKPLYFLGSVLDITERKRAEESLKESEARFRDISESMDEWIWETDAQGIGTFVSEKVRSILGYSAEEILGKTAFDFMPTEEAQRVAGIFSEIIKKKSRIRDLENWNLTKDDRSICMLTNGIPLLDEDGELIGYRGVNREITDRKIVEERLKNSEKLHREAQRVAQIGHWELMPEIGTPSWSEEIFNIFGIDPKNGEPSFVEHEKILHPDDWGLLKEAIEKSTKDGDDFDLNFRILHSEGVRWMHAKGYVELNENGETARIFGTAQNITKVKLAHEALQNSEEQFQQAQKMESVGRLAGGVAHDFNNILTGINGYAEMIMESLKPDDPLYADVKEIHNCGQRAADLTYQLLAFSRKQIIDPKVVNINETVNRLQNMLGRLIEENIDLVFLPAKDLWEAKADPGQLDQILINLAVNARDAMQGGGKLTIETKNVELEDYRCSRCGEFMSGLYVMLAVSDNGCGMEKEMLDKIFEPFFTTKKEGKGTGLGLSTVFGIVHQHGGHLNVYSEPGQGTTFKIYLSRVAEKADEIVEPAANTPTTGTETILLVEDEDIVRDLAKTVLERQGYTVIVAPDGSKAFNEYMGHSGTIDLLLTDVIMPKMNGKELHDKLLKIKPDLKALFMSGYTEDAIAHHGVLKKGMHFVQKPFTIQVLAKAVRKALDS
jgi:PAS domain S-box-containing protein